MNTVLKETLECFEVKFSEWLYNYYPDTPWEENYIETEQFKELMEESFKSEIKSILETGVEDLKSQISEMLIHFDEVKSEYEKLIDSKDDTISDLNWEIEDLKKQIKNLEDTDD